MIETKSDKQAAKIFQLTNFKKDYLVKVSLHSILNFLTGVVYTKEFRHLPENEILMMLKPQGVFEVRKILRKQDCSLKETRLVILTLGKANLPVKVKLGYEVITIRKYVNPLMQCKNWYRFGHTAKWWKYTKTCIKFL